MMYDQTDLIVRENMWKQLRLNRRRLFAIGMVLAASAACRAGNVDANEDELRKYHTKGDVHGLFEIRAEGLKFLRTYNRRHRTDWLGFGPDIRMQVERCLVPLRSRWAVEADRQEGPGVLVVCGKSIQNRRWAALVHAYRPKVDPSVKTGMYLV
jgi:hypothetical protein